MIAAASSAPLPGWVPWVAAIVAMAALGAYWAWPRVANRKRVRR